MKQEEKEWLRNEVQKKTKNLKWEFAEGIFQTEIEVRYFPMNFRCILKSTGTEITAQVMQIYFAYLRLPPAFAASEAETYSGGQALEKVQEGLTEGISALVDEIEGLGITDAILEYQKQIAYFCGKKDGLKDAIATGGAI